MLFLRFFLNPRFLLVYLSIGLLYFAILPWLVGSLSYGQAFFIVLGLLTGGDPYSFKTTVESSNVAWGLAWLIHIASWLIIPILVGMALTEAAVRMKVERRRELVTSLKAWAKASGLSEENAQGFAQEALREIEREE